MGRMGHGQRYSRDPDRAEEVKDRKAYRKAYYERTKLSQREARRVREKANPEKYLAAQRRRYYGISGEEADALLAAQDGRCAICRCAHPGGRGAWHLDHDHASGAVRGFLCQGCNNGLGLFRDDPARLEAAAGYLKQRGRLDLRGSQADKA